MSTRSTRTLSLVSILALALAGCRAPRGETVEDKRAYARRMRDEALADLFAANPSLRARLENTAGYGVFSNIGVKIFLLGTGHGYGLVVDNESGRETYMRMAEVGAGLGLGIKDFRAVFLFRNRGSLGRFVDQGWEFGGGAEAAAIAGDTGVAAAAEGSVGASGATAGSGGAFGVGAEGGDAQETLGGPIEVYVLTKAGISLQATVSGTKYWKDGDLNAP